MGPRDRAVNGSAQFFQGRPFVGGGGGRAAPGSASRRWGRHQCGRAAAGGGSGSLWDRPGRHTARAGAPLAGRFGPPRSFPAAVPASRCRPTGGFGPLRPRGGLPGCHNGLNPGWRDRSSARSGAHPVPIQRSPPSVSRAGPFSGLLAGCQTPHQPPLPVLCGPPSPPRGAAGSRTDPAPTPRSVPGGPPNARNLPRLHRLRKLGAAKSGGMGPLSPSGRKLEIGSEIEGGGAGQRPPDTEEGGQGCPERLRTTAGRRRPVKIASDVFPLAAGPPVLTLVPVQSKTS